MKSPLLLLMIPFLLTGCVTAGVAAGTEAGVSLAEERSLGRKVDDVTIDFDITRMYLRDGSSDLFAGVTIDVRHARVMLTGNVKTEVTAQKAVEYAWRARGVEEVINEIQVNPGANFANAAQDALIKKNLEGRLLLTKDVWVINYSINVVNGTAYLLGRVADQGELNRALNVTRTTRGVKRVVNYLQIRPLNDAPHPAAASGSYTTSTPPSAAASAPAPAPAPAPSSNTGSDGYAAPELIQSRPL